MFGARFAGPHRPAWHALVVTAWGLAESLHADTERVIADYARLLHAYHIDVVRQDERNSMNDNLLRRPCCQNLTLGERGAYEVCNVCGWEDDGQDDTDADVVRGGPNGSLSLTEARARFARTSRGRG